MTKPAQPLPVIKRTFDSRSGEWKWIATTPEISRRHGPGHKFPPMRLMWKASVHARKLNQKAADERTQAIISDSNRSIAIHTCPISSSPSP